MCLYEVYLSICERHGVCRVVWSWSRVPFLFLSSCLTRVGLSALARNRRAVSVVAASALMAVLALAAVAINDSTERTELVYRSSLDIMANPAAGTGSVRHGQRRQADCFARR